MKTTTATFTMATALLLASCATDMSTSNEDNVTFIGRQTNFKITDRKLTPEALWAMGRIGGTDVSPDWIQGMHLPCSRYP